eukprot:GHVP01021109.1.p1 GENE.GHVP01021109.1~~GHVP01021109.1.p1  ORF type:complete len:155 (-),score=9.50 GHVP01021109.1:744-1208(-)
MRGSRRVSHNCFNCQIQFQETHAFWPELCICKTCHTKSQLCFSCERPLLSLACRDAMRLHNWMNLGPLSRYKNMRYESAVESSLAGVCRDCFSIGIVASDAEALIVTWEALLFMEKELGNFDAFFFTYFDAFYGNFDAFNVLRPSNMVVYLFLI